MTRRPKCSCLKENAPRAGFGSLRVLPSGKHQARYTGPDGLPYKAPHTFETHTDADAYLARVRSEISREVWKSPSSTKVPNSFGDYAENWLAGHTVKPRTRDHYRGLLDRLILPTFASTPVAAISPAAVRAWHTRLGNDTPVLRSHAYGLLRTILATAVADEIIPANPCRIRGGGSVKRAVKIKVASLEDVERLVAAMPDKYGAMVLLAAWCGLRFGELTELRRKDVDLKAGVLHVERAVTWIDSKPVVGEPKSDAGIRTVAIPPHLLPAIKGHITEHAQWGKDGLLFPSPKGIQLTSSTLYASWWPARRKAGRPDLRFHDLRHTAAVLAAGTGATLAELMARLGHSTAGAAMRYQHAAQDSDQRIAQRLSVIATEGGAR